MIKLSISSPFTKLQPHAIGRSAVTYEGEVLERKMKGEMPEFLPPCAPLTAACIVINTHLVLTCGNVGLLYRVSLRSNPPLHDFPLTRNYKK